MATFDLTEIFARTFGYKPLQIEVKDEELMNKRNDENGQYGPYYAAAADGREVFMPVTLGGIFLPYTWMSVNNSKTIIETELTEVDYGTVFEEINIQAWKFSLKGLLIGKQGRFPEQDLEKVINLFRRKEALSIKSVLTDMHLLHKDNKTDQVLILDYNLAENPGVQNVRGFTLELKSTREFSLIID